MSIETEDPLSYHRRKARQSAELRGLALADNDGADATLHRKAEEAHAACVREIQMDGACSCAGHRR